MTRAQRIALALWYRSTPCHDYGEVIDSTAPEDGWALIYSPHICYEPMDEPDDMAILVVGAGNDGLPCA